MCLGNYKLPFYLKRGEIQGEIYLIWQSVTPGQLCVRHTHFFHQKSSELSWLMTASWRNISSNHLSKSNNFLSELPPLFAHLSQHPALNFSSLNTSSFQGSNKHKQIVKLKLKKTVFVEWLKSFSLLAGSIEYQIIQTRTNKSY